MEVEVRIQPSERAHGVGRKGWSGGLVEGGGGGSEPSAGALEATYALLRDGIGRSSVFDLRIGRDAPLCGSGVSPRQLYQFTGTEFRGGRVMARSCVRVVGRMGCG